MKSQKKIVIYHISYKLLYYYNNIIIYLLNPSSPTSKHLQSISLFFVFLYFVFCIFRRFFLHLSLLSRRLRRSQAHTVPSFFIEPIYTN